MSFIHKRTVRFAEVDAAQVMYFSRVYELAHETYEELMSAAGFPPGQVFEQGDWGMPLVHTEADYKRPWRLGEVIHIESSIKRASDRSVAFAYRFLDGEGQARTRVEMRHAFVSLSTFRSCQAPEGLLDALSLLVDGD